jgi:hypothetical protein
MSSLECSKAKPHERLKLRAFMIVPGTLLPRATVLGRQTYHFHFASSQTSIYVLSSGNALIDTLLACGVTGESPSGSARHPNQQLRPNRAP